MNCFVDCGILFALTAIQIAASTLRHFAYRSVARWMMGLLWVSQSSVTAVQFQKVSVWLWAAKLRSLYWFVKLWICRCLGHRKIS